MRHSPQSRRVGSPWYLDGQVARVTASSDKRLLLTPRDRSKSIGRMGLDVFISYPHQDKIAADAACATLEAKGIRCWIAPRDIIPGADWGESIINAIAGVRVMVLIFSSAANVSPQIKREVERAVHKGIPIVPVRVEDVLPSRSLEYFISTPHWLDAFTPPLEAHLNRLAISVDALLRESGESFREQSRAMDQIEQRYFEIGAVTACWALVLLLMWLGLSSGVWLVVIFILIGASIAIGAKLARRVSPNPHWKDDL